MKKIVLGPILGFVAIVIMAGQCGGTPPPTVVPDFTLSATAATASVGGTGLSVISINPINGFTDTVSLQVSSGLPTGVTPSFNPATTTTTSNLNLAVASSTTPGSYNITITGDGGGKTNSATFSLNISAVADTTKPTILSVSPTNNKSGVANNINIVIKFSEPMNKASGQAAYQSSSSRIKPSEVSFNWNAAGTQLTINPNINLRYRSITNLLTAAYVYTYKITDTATDLAGNPLANPQTVKFKTLRSMTQKLYSVIDADIRSDGRVGACGLLTQTLNQSCVGDSGSVGNADYKAFFGFSIASLPNDINKIVSAKFSAYQFSLAGDPYGSSMSRIFIEHVDFGSTITFADFNTNVLHNALVLSTTVTTGYKTKDVTISLKDDFTNRASRGNRSQFRLRFEIPTDGDGSLDVARFYTKERTGTSQDPKLVIVYLVP